MSIDRTQIKKAFQAYTDGYDPSDEKIKLKIYHTAKVALISDQISDSLMVSGADKDLAWAIGMLHDIGRFEQIRRFGTFNDAASVDHAKLGADLLFGEESLIDSFGGFEMTVEERRLIDLAIRQHNRFRMDEGLSDRQRRFCDIIRDADKVDILRVNVECPMEMIYGVSREELRQSPVTPEVMDCVEKRSCVLRSLRKTAVDNLVSHIALYFELIYPESRRLAIQQGYLMQMLNFESQNPKTREAFAHMKQMIMEEVR